MLKAVDDGFVAGEGPRRGCAYRVVERKGQGPTESPGPGWRLVEGKVHSVEHDRTYEVWTDAPPPASHHRCHDPLGDLDLYLAGEVQARVLVDRSNRMPTWSHASWERLCCLRPALEAPDRGVRLWPSGAWTEDLRGVCVVGMRMRHRRAPTAIQRFGMLGAALGTDRPRGGLRVTWFDRGLERYEWYEALPRIQAVEGKGLGKAQPGLREAGRPRIAVSWESAGGEERSHEIPCRWWCPDADSVVVRHGTEPPGLEEMAFAFAGGRVAAPGSAAWQEAARIVEKAAAGRAEAHEALERELERRIERAAPEGYRAVVRLEPVQ